MKKNEQKLMSLPMALVTLLIVAGIMSVGLAVLKLNTMVTFILALVAVCVIAVLQGMKLEELQEVILNGFRNLADRKSVV